MVLTAGLGTRLHPLTTVRAKPAVPVAGEPLVRRIARWLAASGVTDIVFNLHHRPATIASALGEGSDLGVRARYSWEQPQILGSAGGPRLALDIIGASRFLVVNGDTLTNIDLAALSRRHAESGAQATLAVVPNVAAHKYGGVRVDGGGRVHGFVAKGQTTVESFHFVGVQMVEAEAFRRLAPGKAVNSIGAFYDELIAADAGAIAAYVAPPDTEFHDIGTVSDYWNTSWALARREGRRAPLTGDRCAVHPTAELGGSILWDDVTIAAGVRLRNCIVTDGAAIPAGAVHEHSVITAAGRTYQLAPFHETAVDD